MKIFEGKEGYHEDKVNFVDENNVFVGYDTDTQCCEHADWFILDRLITDENALTVLSDLAEEIKENEKNRCLRAFNFSTDFIRQISTESECYFAIFELVHNKYNSSRYYLYLFNCHNGYYSHGFEFKIGDEIIKEGCL